MSTLPLVLLHGFMGSEATFDGLRNLEDSRLLPLRIPIPDVTVGNLSTAHDSVARQLLNEIDRHGVDRFDLLGYSLGGRVAMHMALMAPERVNRLILESAHPGLESGEERSERRDHDAEWAGRIRGNWPGILEAWYGQGVFRSLPVSLRQQLIDEKANQDPDLLARMLELLSLGRQRPLWNELGERTLPSLFISGEMDQRYQAVGERLASLSGQIRHLSIKGAGHVVHWEQPEAYLAALQSFLAQ